jgi:hypothetical protein
MVARLVIAAVLALAIATPVEAQQSQSDCAEAALNDYNRANTALLEQASPLMSVEATIAQRRLQEQYCLRFAKCADGNLSESSAPLLAAFSSCLREEALEKYDAVPREGD